jgi:hypothetical protein
MLASMLALYQQISFWAGKRAIKSVIYPSATQIALDMNTEARL